MRQAIGRQGVGFTAVALSDDAVEVARAAAALGLSMPVAIAQGETLGPNGVRGVPALLLVDAQGRVVDRVTGLLGHEALLSRIQALAPRP